MKTRYLTILLLVLAIFFFATSAVLGAVIYYKFTFDANITPGAVAVNAYTDENCAHIMSSAGNTVHFGNLPQGITTNYRFYIRNDGVANAQYYLTFNGVNDWATMTMTNSSGIITPNQIIPVDLGVKVLPTASLGNRTMDVIIRDSP
jgi:hypothetical protein